MVKRRIFRYVIFFLCTYSFSLFAQQAPSQLAPEKNNLNSSILSKELQLQKAHIEINAVSNKILPRDHRSEFIEIIPVMLKSPERFLESDDFIRNFPFIYGNNPKALEYIDVLRQEPAKTCNSLGKPMQQAINEHCEHGRCLNKNEFISPVIRNAVANFDRACFTPNMPENALSNIMKSHTVTIFIDDIITCTGLINGSKLSMAKHCFYDMKDERSDSVKPGYLQLFSTDSARQSLQLILSFSNYQPPYTKRKVAVSLPFSTPKSSDVLEILLDKNATADQLPVDTVREFDSIFIYAVNPFLPNSVDDWQTAVRSYNMPSCTVLKVENQCLSHSCTTFFTNSGAPIYAVKNGNVRAIAIHSGWGRFRGRQEFCSRNTEGLFTMRVNSAMPLISSNSFLTLNGQLD